MGWYIHVIYHTLDIHLYVICADVICYYYKLILLQIEKRSHLDPCHWTFFWLHECKHVTLTLIQIAIGPQLYGIPYARCASSDLATLLIPTNMAIVRVLCVFDIFLFIYPTAMMLCVYEKWVSHCQCQQCRSCFVHTALTKSHVKAENGMPSGLWRLRRKSLRKEKKKGSWDTNTIRRVWFTKTVCKSAVQTHSLKVSANEKLQSCNNIQLTRYTHSVKP